MIDRLLSNESMHSFSRDNAGSRGFGGEVDCQLQVDEGSADCGVIRQSAAVCILVIIPK